ncbi:MAG: hypothetical protein PHS97_01190 [Oscillospiraceae bacterium]|nr:hypothetical protein [Oscillospiraceae bacterium]
MATVGGSLSVTRTFLRYEAARCIHAARRCIFWGRKNAVQLFRRGWEKQGNSEILWEKWKFKKYKMELLYRYRLLKIVFFNKIQKKKRRKEKRRFRKPKAPIFIAYAQFTKLWAAQMLYIQQRRNREELAILLIIYESTIKNAQKCET